MTAPAIDTKLVLEPTVQEMKGRLDKKRRELADMSPVMGQVAVFLDQWVQENFKTEGGKVGGWLPFARGGRMRNGKLDTSAKLLQDTGRLRLSFLPFASKTDAGIGSRQPYSEAHHLGIGVPERRLLPFAKEVRGPIKEKFNVHVKKGVEA